MLNNPNINMATLRVACSNCNLRELCLPVGLNLKEIEQLEEIVSTRRRVKRGDALTVQATSLKRFTQSAWAFLKAR